MSKTPVKRFQKTSKFLSNMKNIEKTNQEKKLARGNVEKNELELKCERVLFYIFMFVDMYHDYLTNIKNEKRGTIVHKMFSFYETLDIILSNINIREREKFAYLINRLYLDLDTVSIRRKDHLLNYVYQISDNDFTDKTMKYKKTANTLFTQISKIPISNIVLRNNRIVNRSHLKNYKINIHKFNHLFDINGLHSISLKMFITVLCKINKLNILNINKLYNILDIPFYLNEKSNSIDYRKFNN